MSTIPPCVLTRRLALAAALAFIASACSGDVSAPASEPFITSFDRMWLTVDREYSYFDYKAIDWPEVRRQYRPRAEAARSTEELVGVVRDALATLRDVHVWILSPGGGTLPTYQPTNRRNWSPVMLAALRQRPGWLDVSSAVGGGDVDGIPVIAISTFANGRFDPADFDRLLTAHRDAPALILDVRMNGGGNDALAYAVAGRFTSSGRVGGYYQFRNGLRHDAFTSMTPRAIAPRGSWQFTRPVILLTGSGAFSSAEGFVSAMRSLPNVTVVGDTTGGGSGNPSVYPLREGYGISVSRWIEYTADREPIEWRGIAPDSVVVFTDAAVVAGADETMAAGLSLARRLSGGGAPVVQSTAGTVAGAR